MRTTKKMFREAEAHAIAEYPRESCGLVVDAKGGLRYHACENTATSPSQHFRIRGEDWIAASKLGKVVGVVHSHPDGAAKPSEGDLAACEATAVPWHILAVHADENREIAVVDRYSWQPDGFKAPLVGRSFHYGVLDCWTLARDWYREERGIDMPDVDHGPDDWWEDTESDFSPYEDESNYEKCGLVRLPLGTDLKEGDLIVMQVRSKSSKPNHVGILIDAERGIMLHHLYHALSERTVYGGYWREVTRFILRRKDDE